MYDDHYDGGFSMVYLIPFVFLILFFGGLVVSMGDGDISTIQSPTTISTVNNVEILTTKIQCTQSLCVTGGQILGMVTMGCVVLILLAMFKFLMGNVQ